MAGLYARMARIGSDALDDEEAAIDLWARVLDIRGEDSQALSALGDLYARREMWDELVEVLEREVGVAESEEQQTRLFKRLGRVWSEKLGRERNALDAWLSASALAPNESRDPWGPGQPVSRHAVLGRGYRRPCAVLSKSVRSAVKLARIN